MTPAEMEDLCHALRAGRPPRDLDAKILRLREDDLRERYLRQQSRLLLSVLIAAAGDGFCRARPMECQRLLRMLAYVRKDNDAIPDTWPDGFQDDHDLMRLICAELKPVLEAYKAWHLARRVPLLW